MIRCRSCRLIIGQRSSDGTAAYLPGLVPLSDRGGVPRFGLSARARKGNPALRKARTSLHVAPERMRTLIERGQLRVARLPTGLVVHFDDPMSDPPAPRNVLVRLVEWSPLPCAAYCPSCGAENVLALG